MRPAYVHRVMEMKNGIACIAGYFTADDVSVRDLQTRTSQWLLGKTMDKFFPIGPYLVTADEVPDPQALGLKCWVNGDLRQDSNTADMIFSVAQVIAYTSQFFTLEPGDVITIKDRSANIVPILGAMELAPGRIIPGWLSLDQASRQVTVLAAPTRTQIDIPVAEQLIVELYSK